MIRRILRQEYVSCAVFVLCFFLSGIASGQRKIREYHLTIQDKMINITGKPVMGIGVNDSFPGPTLYFREGDSAVISITNQMKMESSIHWHGILLPNYMDGVPYLTSPPIEPGKTFTVRFPVIQSGTYWYHSHSMLQEQSGLYGAIVIYPKKEIRHYNRDIVLVLSDWTNEKPRHVLNNLKRNTEWYAIRKGQPQSLNRVLSHHGLGERIKMAWQRMPPMDISDVFYNSFLTNGDSVLHFPEVFPGEHIRLRVIDGSSSTFFHLQYSGGQMKIISADGQDVKPVQVDRMLIGIAETYDLVITIPGNGQYELRATAQDGSGHTSVYFGKGKLFPAPELPGPDLFHMMGVMMQGMGGMKMKMDGMNMSMSNKLMTREMPYIQKDSIDEEDLNIAGSGSMQMPGMDMDGMQGMNMKGMDSSKIPGMEGMIVPADTGHPEMKSRENKMNGMNGDSMDSNGGGTKTTIFNYDMLRSLHPTTLDTSGHLVRDLTFNLTGTMWRYIWTINDKTLSQDDSIRVDPGEILRIKLVNETMMYHPMHLHGHLFRVLNVNGDYSPLKHTVIVPPMHTVTIEFEANEYPGAWFFHCHVLYHMMAGMARVFQYSNYVRDSSLAKYPVRNALQDDNAWFFWGNGTLNSNMGELNLMYSNRRNALTYTGDAGWWKPYNKNEEELSYEYFLTPYLRPYAGVVTSNKPEYLDYFSKRKETKPIQDTRALIGVRFLLPLFINADLRVDSRAHVRLQLAGETWLFPRIWMHYMWNTDEEFGVNLEYRFSQYVSVNAGYHSDYHWGGGLLVRF